MKKSITIFLIILGSIALITIVYFAITVTIQDERDQKNYGICLKVFSDKYCNESNYSSSEIWGNGINYNQYFKCKEERSHDGVTQGFDWTEEEMEFCKNEVRMAKLDVNVAESEGDKSGN